MPSDHIARTRAAREITRESRLREAIDAANIGETNRRILRMRYIDGRCFSYIAAVEEFNNVFAAAFVEVPRGCCLTVSVENTSTQAITIDNANMLVERVA